MYLRESFHHLYKKTCWAKTWPIINRRINILQPQAFVVHSWTDGGTNTLDRCLHVSLSPEHDCGDVFQGNLFVCEVQPPLLFLSTWSGSSKGKKNVSSIRGFTAALTQQPHSLRHNWHDNNDDDGCYGDRVRGQAGEKHICRVAFGRRRKRRRWRDGRAAVWVLPLCESFSGLPVHFDTGIRVLEAVREKCVCCCWRGLGAGSKPRVRGLATCPKSKL